MKVYQIVEAPETKKSSGASSSFNLGKKTSGGVIVPDNFDIKKAPLTVENGEIIHKAKDGTVTKSKKPSEVAKKTLSQKALSKLKQTSVGKVASVIGKVGLLKLSLGAQGAAIIAEAYFELLAFNKMWEDTYPSGHVLAKGSPYATKAYNAVRDPILYASFAQAATVMALEVSRIIKAGKVRRIVTALNAATTPLAAIPGAGWLAKALIFALTEGAIWAAGWAVNKYGRELFHYILNNEFEEMFNDIVSLGKPPKPAKEVDVNAVKDAIKKELKAQGTGDIPKPPSSDIKADLKSKGIDTDKITIPD